MALRKPYIGGNWKMNLHDAEASALAHDLAERCHDNEQVDVVICPAFPYLRRVASILQHKGSPIRVGAQDFYHQPNGAFTGEVSLSMLQDVDASVVLVGHSERRHILGEQDELINAKGRAALDAGMQVILCVGETLEQRERNQTDQITTGQLTRGLADVTAEQMANVTIAYEPVWAIGTGRAATPSDAQAAHATIRAHLAEMFSEYVAQATRIQYGGSVNPRNAADLFAQPDVDGFLVGGASLDADQYVAIIDATK